MYENPVLFPPVSNRESWIKTLGIYDDDTGDAIALTDSNGSALYDIELDIVAAGPTRHTTTIPPGPYYDTDCEATINASLANYLSIPDTGIISINIPKSVMQTLRAQTYDVFISITDTANDDGRQILIGKLPVIYGGRNT